MLYGRFKRGMPGHGNKPLPCPFKMLPAGPEKSYCAYTVFNEIRQTGKIATLEFSTTHKTHGAIKSFKGHFK